MIDRPLLLLACLALGLAWRGDAVADHRPIDRFGPMVKSIHDQPVPADIDGLRVWRRCGTSRTILFGTIALAAALRPRK